MPDRQFDQFVNAHVPGRGYHAFNGQIPLYNEKNLSFSCGCGGTHSVSTSLAVIDFPLENKGMYICPNNERIFVLVKATGVFSVKGLKTVASYAAPDAVVRQQIMSLLESRKKRDK